MDKARNQLLWAVREINHIHKKRGKEFLSETPNMKPWTCEYWEKLAKAAYQEVGNDHTPTNSRAFKQVEELEDDIAHELDKALQWLDRDGRGAEATIYTILDRLQGTFNNGQSSIDEFAQKFGEDTKYSPGAIAAYLTLWTEYEGVTNRRAKAKRAWDINEKPADGTLENWEKKWMEFAASRTVK